MSRAVTRFPIVDPELRRRLTRTARAAAANTRERDRLIAAAYRSGSSMREIARVVGLTHPGVRAILLRDRIIEDVTRRADR